MHANGRGAPRPLQLPPANVAPIVPPSPAVSACTCLCTARLAHWLHSCALKCRTPEEHAQGAVPGSINIPVKLDDGKGGFVDNPQFLEQASAHTHAA